MRRHLDWFHQAEEDINAAKDSIKLGHFEWSCFQSQQAAEKTVKAFLEKKHRLTRGHSVLYLLQEAKSFLNIPEKLEGYARELDEHYIPSRYPNGFPNGYPAQFYDQQKARRCLDYAQELNSFFKPKIVCLNAE